MLFRFTETIYNQEEGGLGQLAKRVETGQRSKNSLHKGNGRVSLAGGQGDKGSSR